MIPGFGEIKKDGIQKDGNDNPICKTEKETQMYRLLDSMGEGEGGMI